MNFLKKEEPDFVHVAQQDSSNFKLGERVLCQSSGTEGRITQVLENGVSVDLIPGPGSAEILWGNLRRSCNSGDYVLIVSGPHTGKEGWIVDADRELSLASVSEVVGGITLTNEKVWPIPLHTLV